MPKAHDRFTGRNCFPRVLPAHGAVPENEAKACEGLIKADIAIVDLTPEQIEEFCGANLSVPDMGEKLVLQA